MRRRISELLLTMIFTALSGLALQRDDGVHDAEFDKVPFAEWFPGPATREG
jgi:hypothetical protein